VFVLKMLAREKNSNLNV